MANRKALHELQQRIAKLLQQASAEGGITASWLGVRLGRQKILLPLQQSGEIYPLSQTQPVAYAKPWFQGVAALRGQVYGVVDFVAFMPEVVSGNTTDKGRQRLVAMNEALGVNVVFRVDALEGLRGRDDFVRSESPPSGAPDYFGSVFHDKTGGQWQEINLQTLVQRPEFLDIALNTSADSAENTLTNT